MKIRITKHELRIMVFAVIALFMIHNSLLISPALAACTPTASGINIVECFGFGGITSLGQGTSQLVTPIFSIAATLVVIYFLLGAFKYLKSAGNKEEVQGASQMITQAIIGFVILIFAFFVLQFLLSSLFGITNSQLIQTR